MLNILPIPALSDNYIYLLQDSISGETAVIDPAIAEPVLEVLAKKAWQLNYIFNTHHHDDHIDGNRQLKQHTGCKLVAAAADRQRISNIDIEVADGDQIFLGQQAIQIISTPGHTLGHLVYYHADNHALFCGDTLFSMGCGRLFEGSAEQMWQSLQRLKALPTETRVYCAHEYTEANARFALSVEDDNPQLHQRYQDVVELRRRNLSTLPSTIAQELATNPFLREDSASIQRNIDMTEKAPAEIFAKLRSMKDQFR